MEQIIRIKYYNPHFNIGLVNYREAWLLDGQFPEKLYTEVHKGKLVFRRPGSFRRIGYTHLKKGLIKKEIIIKEPPLPF